MRSGQIGEVFHYESFIGGYGHPCNYWHSDEAVSGGAIYDWGSHYLDWVLDLFPQQVEWVSATAHKRVWHDVTNADHSRVLVHFADGVEAEFTHSDLAAALKPKFYVLGTEGGHHRRLAVRGGQRPQRRSAPCDEDLLAHSDAPADLRVFTPNGARPHPRDPAGRSRPPRRSRSTASSPTSVLSGEPMDVTPEGSKRNIAVMQAATDLGRAGRPAGPAADR